MNKRSIQYFFRSGRPWIWLSATSISALLFLILALLLILISNSMSFVWPQKLQQFSLNNGDFLVGQKVSDKGARQETQWLIKTANRDQLSAEYQWIKQTEIKRAVYLDELLIVERSWDGDFFGRLVRPVIYYDGDNREVTLVEFLERSHYIQQQLNMIREHQLKDITEQFEQVLAQLPEHQKSAALLSSVNTHESLELETLRQAYQNIENRLNQLMLEANNSHLLVLNAKREYVEIPMLQVVDAYFPNVMSLGDKLSFALERTKQLFNDKPRDANSAGGLYPALVGTVVMVFVMTIVVTPLGIVAAIYLHEYAKDGWMKKLINLSVANLAGIPSIIYGVFGLGFFVYGLGGSLDQLFYPEALPSPTFGAPGLLWCSLTLALLTLPIVIVTTEQGMARIPKELRLGSMALGASRLETVTKLVLPAAYPAMLTGLILAIARAAGEVAAVMLVGVAKNTPALPVTNEWPYVHLEQQVMHLGFMVYDAGLQTPHLYSAKPLVFAAALVLVLLTMSLNLMAMGVRSRLQDKYRYFVS